MAALAVTYGVQPGTACRAWCEETLTIAPCVPDARKRRIAVAHPTTAGLRFIAMRSSTVRAGAEWSEASRNTAALLTQPVSVPAACARSAARSVTSSSAASPATAITRGPAGWSSTQVSAAGSSSIATTVPASLRSRSTTALPIPRPPPVTT